MADLLGDVTGDDRVNSLDAQAIARYAAGSATPYTSRMTTNGDANSDASTNIIDAQQVLRYSSGLSVAFDIGEEI